jgi:hypothetical protein
MIAHIRHTMPEVATLIKALEEVECRKYVNVGPVDGTLSSASGRQ